MKMFINLKTKVYINPETDEEIYFDEEKLNHALVTFWSKVIGRFNYVVYLADVTITEANIVIDTLTNDPTIEKFVPLLEYTL